MIDDEDTQNASAFVERLQVALGDRSQAVIAKRARVSTSVMSRYLQGSEPGLFKAVRLARETGVDLMWLATGKGQPNAAGAGFVEVPIFDVRLAAGTASFAEGAQQIGTMPLDMEILRAIGRTTADDLAVFEAEGDSMEPLIADGGRVVADLRDTRLRDGIFAFRFGDELRIKRLQRVAEGIQIRSENPRYDVELLTGDLLDQFAIIGRIRWTATVI